MNSEKNDERVPAMPPLWAVGRRALLLLLIGLGLLMGVVSVLLAAQTGALVGAFSLALVAGVVGLTLLFGMGKFVERILAERLGQHYVAQLRRGLLRHSLNASRAPSLGITVARSTNDLSSVRNWVIQGLLPLTAGIPVLLFTLLGLWLTAPILVLALIIPLSVELVLLLFLATGAFRTARRLRQRRGSLAARIADTMAAATSIRAAGGVEREVKRADQSAQKVVRAAVERARYAGALRATALSVPLLGSTLVVALASRAELGTAAIASGLLLIGLSSAVLGEFGRMVEYRQNYKAARRILSPLLAAEQAVPTAGEQRLPPGAIGNAPKAVRVELGGGPFGKWPAILAQPGERIQMDGPGTDTERILQRIATGHLEGSLGHGGVWVSGRNLSRVSDRQRRKLLGAALPAMVLERGTLGRALRYRSPNSKPEVALALAAKCGLAIEELPEREQTMLLRGGEPLNQQQRAALLLARALLDNPPLLLIDSVISQLDPRVLPRVAHLLNDYPGVVIYRGEIPGVPPTRLWQPRDQAITAPLPVLPAVRG